LSLRDQIIADRPGEEFLYNMFPNDLGNVSPNDHSNPIPFPELLADWLVHSGVDHIFYVPGASIDFLLKSLLTDKRFQCYGAIHESTAAFMADGVFQLTGKPAAVLAIGGPGALNMATAAYTCAQHHTPVIFISGEAPSFLSECGTFQHVGNGSFSINGVFSAISCLSEQILNGISLKNAFERFLNAMEHGKPVPLHLSIPCDVALYTFPNLGFPPSAAIADPKMTLFDRPGTNTSNNSPLRVALWLGDQMTDATFDRLKKMAVAANIPVAVTTESLFRLSELPEFLRSGIFGYAGHENATNLILDPELDLLIIAGVELTEKNTYCWHQDIFHPHRHVVMISREMRHTWPHPMELTAVRCDEESLITSELTDQSSPLYDHLSIHSDWRGTILKKSNENKYKSSISTEYLLNPTTVGIACTLIAQSITDEQAVFTDSGDHRYFATYHFAQKPHPCFHSAPRTAPMGWAIGAGMGAAAAMRETRTIIITGDGCMLMHGNEISTAVKYQLPLTIIIMNNRGYGKIRRRFDAENKLKESSPGSLPKIEWPSFIKSLGSACFEVDTIEDLMSALDDTNKMEGPATIIIEVNEDEDYPNPAAMFSSCAPGFIQQWMNKNK
jgi:acetolactate synthase-1/2/3 large subunit